MDWKDKIQVIQNFRIEKENVAVFVTNSTQVLKEGFDSLDNAKVQNSNERGVWCDREKESIIINYMNKYYKSNKNA